jgi:hypothetical protein
MVANGSGVQDDIFLVAYKDLKTSLPKIFLKPIVDHLLPYLTNSKIINPFVTLRQ